MKIRRKCTNRHKCLIIPGFTICTLGIILLLLKIWIIELLTKSLLVLKPNSLIESVWRKVPDVRTDVYFLNWTNPEDFHNLTIKPKFKDVGPYIFIQTLEKIGITWNNNNDTVTYSQQRRYYLDDKSANSNFSEEITTINFISMALSHHIRNKNYLLKKLISAYLSTAAPYVNTTITLKQALFDGLDDLLIEIGNAFPFVFAEIPRFHKLNIFSFAIDSKLFEGILNTENGVDGSFEILNWNFYNTSPYFDDFCAKVYGSAGELYSTKLIRKTKHIGIFASMICRHVKLDFEDEVTINGIVGYKYSVGDSLLDNGTLISGNECYCGDNCVPSGIVSISSCRYGLPLYLSLPHFYRADPIYLDAVEGLHPKKEKHEAYVVVEPTTGILLSASMRVQLNMRVHPIEDISVYENVREIFFPLMWMEQTAALPDNIFLLLKICLMLPHLLTVIGSIFLTLGFILICILFQPMFISCIKKQRGEQNQDIVIIPEQIPLHSCDKIVVTNGR